MAYTLSLTDGTTTYNLIDGSNTYGAQRNTLDLGTAEVVRALHQSLLRTGVSLTAHTHAVRRISLALTIIGTSVTNLVTNIQNINKALLAARQWSTLAAGNKWQLKYNPGGSAKDIYFTLRDGQLILPPPSWNAAALALTSPIITRGQLSLICDPFADGDSESIENFVDDAGFEVAGTALADWTELKTATGTTARDTTVKHHGDASLKLVMTAGSSGQVVGRNQTLNDVDAAEIWSYQVHVRVDELTQCKVVLKADYTGGAPDDEVSTTTVDASQFVPLTLANKTAPASTTACVLRIRLEATGASPTGTVYVDSVIAVQATSIPTTWVSSHNVHNNLDDDDQAGVNYLDIESVPGDAPAKLQLKALEDENHTKFWAGARHASRQYDGDIRHEVEDFLDGGGSALADTADGTSSDGNHAELASSPQFDTSSTDSTGSPVGSFTKSHTTGDKSNRLLLVAVWFDSTRAVSGITYGGTSMTLTQEVVSGPEELVVYQLVDPASGANDVVCTFSGGNTAYSCVILSYYGVDQTNPRGTVATKTGSGFAVGGGIDATSVDGDLVVGFCGISNAGDIIPGGGETQRAEINNSVIGVQGEDERATTTTTNMGWTWFNSTTYAAVAFALTAATAAAPLSITKAITTPPEGVFRVLIRVRNDNAYNLKVGVGYKYGGVTKDPSVANDYGDVPTTTTGWHILDIGSLVVPTFPLPDGATIGELTIRVLFYDATADGGASFDLDWLLLLPVDGGAAYATKTAATEIVVIDTISDVPVLSLWDSTSLFKSIPEQAGSMIRVDPEGTRIYMIDDDGSDAGITEGWTVTAKVIPQYLHVG